MREAGETESESEHHEWQHLACGSGSERVGRNNVDEEVAQVRQLRNGARRLAGAREQRRGRVSIDGKRAESYRD